MEATYDAYLSGEHGESQVMVDANGRRISVMSDIKDTKGNDLYLTSDARAQYVADAALAKLIAPSGGVIGTGKGSKGAVVALDVTDGSVLVMSSFPTFDPTKFTGAFSDVYKRQEEEFADSLMARACARSRSFIYACLGFSMRYLSRSSCRS